LVTCEKTILHVSVKSSSKMTKAADHRLTEKRRRDRISDTISHLKNLVPSCSLPSPSVRQTQLSILEKTVAYIIELKTQVAALSGLCSGLGSGNSQNPMDIMNLLV
jgi:hypothetical protein